MKDLIIKEGISEKQIQELLHHTHTDDIFKTHTNDRKRFESRRHFDKWLNRGKKLFVLINKQKKLLGIIWMSKKQIPKQAGKYKEFSATFAIRIYGKARGKKLAIPFMNEVFARIKYKKIWLTVLASNQPAINLYKKFGFENIYSDDKIQIMIYEKKQNA